jgi:hypothetical protein
VAGRDLSVIVENIDTKLPRPILDPKQAAIFIAVRKWGKEQVQKNHLLITLSLFAYLLDGTPEKYRLSQAVGTLTSNIKPIGKVKIMPDIFQKPAIIESSHQGTVLFADVLNIGIYPFDQGESVGFLVYRENMSYESFALRYDLSGSEIRIIDTETITSYQRRIIGWLFKYYLLMTADNTPFRKREIHEDSWLIHYYTLSGKVGGAAGIDGCRLRLTVDVSGMQRWDFEESNFNHLAKQVLNNRR